MEGEGFIDNKYIIIKKIGEGAYGKVYLVKAKDTNKEFAVKVLQKEDKTLKIKIKIIKTFSSLKNKNIINMINNGKGPFIRKGKDKGEKEYIVYEYAPKGTLFDYFTNPNKGSLEENYAKILFKNILKGVQAMHNNKICHRDIKLENILLDENYNPKICDFGFVIQVHEGRKLKGRCGTRGYCAPEILKEKKEYTGYDGIKADIFSLGISLLSLVTGKQDKNIEKIIEANKFDEYKEKLKIQIKDTSPEFQSLIIKMIDFNPDNRPKIDKILTEPWFNGINDNDLKQQEDYIKEFNEREEIKKSKKDSIESSETSSSIECFNSDKALEEEDYQYFRNDYNIELVNEENINIKDHIKIIGNISNPRKFMNSIANKIKRDNENYKIEASNNKYKFYVNLEYEIEDDEEKFENEIEDMEDEYIDFENNGLNKKDLKILIELILIANNNDYLIRFYKKSGDLEDYYEKLNRIKSLIKSL